VSEETQEQPMTLRDTIVPKSDQINYDDVASAPMTVKVAGLAKGSAEQPVVVRIADDATGAALRDFKPCKTMRRVLIAVWGDKGREWIGKRMTLVGDASVTFGPAKVGGIRISHVSGIDKPATVLVSAARGKRVEVTVRPLEG
jgi:hypothetical protein